MTEDIKASESGIEKPARRRPRVKVEADKDVSFFGYIREWADALIIAFVVAMFIRTYVVELFKIPTGSMSPTLLGDFISEGPAKDRDGEAQNYLLIAPPDGQEALQVFRKLPDGYFEYEGRQSARSLTPSQQLLLGKFKREEHRILVNKFAYWFKQPERGDIAIFRVLFKLNPEAYQRNGGESPLYNYDRNQSVYVKRVVGLGGERLQIGEDDGHLYVDGEMVSSPEILAKTQYINPGYFAPFDVVLPEKHVAMFGDNSDNSLDSRYWGPLPEANLRGKAIFTYYPFNRARFLDPE